mgnify:CR=1 FL=1
MCIKVSRSDELTDSDDDYDDELELACDKYSKANMLARYMLELTLPEVDCVAYPPCALAAAALRLTAWTLDGERASLFVGTPCSEQVDLLPLVDAALDEAGCYHSQRARETIDSCARRLRGLHARASQLRKNCFVSPRASTAEVEPPRVHSPIYDKYCDECYWSIAKEVQPAATELPALVGRTRSARRSERRRSERLSFARHGFLAGARSSP